MAMWRKWASSIKGEHMSQETHSIKVKYHPHQLWMGKQEAEILTHFKHQKFNKTKPKDSVIYHLGLVCVNMKL